MTSTGFGLLSLITFFPLVGAVAIASLNKEAKGNARWIALYMTLFTLGASIYLWANFDQGNPGFQFVEEMDWLGGSIRYKMGVDGISVLFVVLTAFLMPLCILASWQSIEERVKEYMEVRRRLPPRARSLAPLRDGGWRIPDRQYRTRAHRRHLPRPR